MQSIRKSRHLRKGDQSFSGHLQWNIHLTSWRSLSDAPIALRTLNPFFHLSAILFNQLAIPQCRTIPICLRCAQTWTRQVSSQKEKNQKLFLLPFHFYSEEPDCNPVLPLSKYLRRSWNAKLDFNSHSSFVYEGYCPQGVSHITEFKCSPVGMRCVPLVFSILKQSLFSKQDI